MALGYLGKTLVAASLGAMALGTPLPANAAPAPEPAPLEQTVEDCEGCGPVGAMEIPVPSQTVGMATYVHRAADGSVISETKIGIKPSRRTAAIKGSVRTTTVDYLDEGDTADLRINPGESVEVWGPWATYKRSGTLRTDLPKNRNEDELARRIGAVDQFSRDGRQYAQITYDELQDNDLTAVNLTYNGKLFKTGKRGPNGEAWCSSSAFDVIVSRVAEDSVRVEERVREIHHHHYDKPASETSVNRGRKKIGKCSDGKDNDGDGLVDFQQEGDININIGGNTYWGVDKNGNGRLDRNDLFRDPGCHGPNDGEKWNRGKTKKLLKWIAGERGPAPYKEIGFFVGAADDQITSESASGQKFDQQFTLGRAGLKGEKFNRKSLLSGTVVLNKGSETIRDGRAEETKTVVAAQASADIKILGPLTVSAGAEYISDRTGVNLGYYSVDEQKQTNAMVEGCLGATAGAFSSPKFGTIQYCETFQSVMDDFGFPGIDKFSATTSYERTPNIKTRFRIMGDNGWYGDFTGRFGLGDSTIYSNSWLSLENNSDFWNFKLEVGKAFGKKDNHIIAGRLGVSHVEADFAPDPAADISQAMRDALTWETDHNNTSIDGFYKWRPQIKLLGNGN